MAYNEFLADRVRISLKDNQTTFEEKKMFGGICFLVDEKMCLGVIKDDLMVRLDPEIQVDVIKEKIAGQWIKAWLTGDTQTFITLSSEPFYFDNEE